MNNLWPQPSKQPNVQTPSEPGGISVGSVAAYTAPLRFVGRMLDSNYTQQLQYGPRTLRAYTIRAAIERNKLFGIMGSHLVWWGIDRTLQRLDGNEPLTAIYRTNGPAESWLPPDASFYPEQAWAGEIDKTDGDRRTFAFDWDSRGYVYVGCDPGGWGILQEGSLASVHHHIAQPGDAAANGQLIAFKTNIGRYHLMVIPNAFANADEFDVTDVNNPFKIGTRIWNVSEAVPPNKISYVYAPSAAKDAGYLIIYGIESYGQADWTGTLNARLYKADGTPIPLLTPKGEQYFAVAYASKLAQSKGYAQYVGDPPIAGPNFCSSINDVAIVERGGKVYAIFAIGAFLDVYEIGASSEPVPQPSPTPIPPTPDPTPTPNPQPTSGPIPGPTPTDRIAQVQTELGAASAAIQRASALLNALTPAPAPAPSPGPTEPPFNPNPQQPPAPQPAPQPAPTPAPQHDPLVGTPCDRSTPLPDGYLCVEGRVVRR